MEQNDLDRILYYYFYYSYTAFFVNIIFQLFAISEKNV